ncbi:MAG: hypothetical protein ACI4RA_04465 [Kiritimatiellia bacterium]
MRALVGRLVCLVAALFACHGLSAAGAKPAPRAPIAVVKAVTSCTVADRGYAAQLANRTVRWLASGGVKADLIDDRALEASLKGRRLVYLVVCQKPSAAQLQALARLRARGGKIAVLQSYSPALAAFMGVPAQTVAPPRSVPVQVRRVPAGWWSANIFGADGLEEAKARLLLDMAGQAVPGAWNAAAWEARRTARLAAEREYGRLQLPRPGEIHAVWDHTGEGLYPGDWPRTMRLLRANGVTDLFVNVAGAGFAHYPSRILPRSQVCAASGDQLAACLAAARGTGVRVHAWVLCFTAARGSPARLAALAKRGWRLKDKAGRLSEYLDPLNADLRAHLLAALDELARGYSVAGIHLDFVRWYEGAATKPRNPAASVTSFVAAARARVRAARPRMWLTAAVLPSYPSCVRSVGQDWEAWIDRGLIDYAVPMNYFENHAKYEAAVTRQANTRARARRLISGIGVTANESALSPVQVIDQVNAARRAGLAGVALFDLDSTLAARVLPVLRLGLFRPVAPLPSRARPRQ